MFTTRKRKYKAIGINIYGGGFTLGVLNHFEVLGQWEEFKLGCRTFDLNFTGIPRPLCHHTAWPVKDYVGKAALVYANPPCVPWSSASSYSERTGQIGTRHGKTIAHRFADPLLDLTDHTMTAAMALRPRVFISESVENAYNIGARHYDQYVEAWHQLGYATTFFLTDAVLHGAPCRRRRFHFIAHNCELKLPRLPNPAMLQVITVRDVIGDLETRPLIDDEFQHLEANRWKNHPRLRKYMKLPPPGDTLRKHLPADFDGPKPSIFCRRLHWDIPAFTMMGFDNLIHPTGKRWLTYREGMRLMSYPDTFRMYGRAMIDIFDSVIPVIGDLLAATAKRSIVADHRCPVEHRVVDWRPLGVGLSGKAALKRLSA